MARYSAVITRGNPSRWPFAVPDPLQPYVYTSDEDDLFSSDDEHGKIFSLDAEDGQGLSSSSLALKGVPSALQTSQLAPQDDMYSGSELDEASDEDMEDPKHYNADEYSEDDE